MSERGSYNLKRRSHSHWYYVPSSDFAFLLSRSLWEFCRSFFKQSRGAKRLGGKTLKQWRLFFPEVPVKVAKYPKLEKGLMTKSHQTLYILVELRGIEPLTPWMPFKCAPSCATAPYIFLCGLPVIQRKVGLKKTETLFQERGVLSSAFRKTTWICAAASSRIWSIRAPSLTEIKLIWSFCPCELNPRFFKKYK